MPVAANPRRESARKKAVLSSEVQQACASGQWLPGQLAPSVNELAARYRMSVAAVHREIRKLVEEGVLYTVPRKGTFVGRPQGHRHDFFLMVCPFLGQQPMPHRTLMQHGFEECIAELGGASLILEVGAAQAALDNGQLDNLRGVFEFHSHFEASPLWTQFVATHPEAERVAHVEYGEVGEGTPDADKVFFDNVGAGRQATGHLLGMGHRDIGFLGLHGENERGEWTWSLERQQGWQQALEQAGLGTHGLAFHPLRSPGHAFEAQVEAGRRAAREIVRRELGAVVTVSSFAMRGLCLALQDAKVPLDRWPVVVDFDDVASGADRVLSSVRQPWDELGREAARLLWERSRGVLPAQPQQRLLAMRLVTRMQRNAWPLALSLSQGASSIAAV